MKIVGVEGLRLRSLSRVSGMAWTDREDRLQQPVAWASNGGLRIDFVDEYRLIAVTLRGRDGSIEPGRRQIKFAWFDAHLSSPMTGRGFLTTVEDAALLASLVAERCLASR